MNTNRIRTLKPEPGKALSGRGPVVYWMSRDQRAEDNWALLFAQDEAVRAKVPLVVAFCVVPSFLGATAAQYAFMLGGLREVEERLLDKNIHFDLVTGDPGDRIPELVKAYGARCLVTDFDPLRVKRAWKKAVSAAVNTAFFEVDAHNVVPCWIASDKQEYAARTLRPKLTKLTPEYLEEFPRLKRHPFELKGGGPPVDWQGAERWVAKHTPAPPPSSPRARPADGAPAGREADAGQDARPTPGTSRARRVLARFLAHGLALYDRRRNDPNAHGTSSLSPYLHFGQISAQRVALEVGRSRVNRRAREAFLEELVVRRELSDNFCFYNPHYESVRGFPDWAVKTLSSRLKDRREYVYSLGELERAQTHDPLWNAAQAQMLTTGRMHGYMRMYWAKKILEWTESPEEAMRAAGYLNDTYELDGRDPNGYAGIAWAIGGVHDRPWPGRRVFGTIRYMSYDGCKAKFDVEAYIRRYAVERD
ncbi:MAG: deoxyribodipyrimidine photo-lyase [Candidatus Eisenbacteria bacterium]|nr:deoxyribodipyrimidine photo-lyase [Candidatus Eisenbacteria bacterium]